MIKIPQFYAVMNINDTVVKEPDKELHLHLIQGFVTACLRSPYQISMSSWASVSHL